MPHLDVVSFLRDQFKQLLRCFIPCQHHRHEPSTKNETRREDVLHVPVTADGETAEMRGFQTENVSLIRDVIKKRTEEGLLTFLGLILAFTWKVQRHSASL